MVLSPAYRHSWGHALGPLLSVTRVPPCAFGRARVARGTGSATVVEACRPLPDRNEPSGAGADVRLTVWWRGRAQTATVSGYGPCSRRDRQSRTVRELLFDLTVLLVQFVFDLGSVTSVRPPASPSPHTRHFLNSQRQMNKEDGENLEKFSLISPFSCSFPFRLGKRVQLRELASPSALVPSNRRLPEPHPLAPDAPRSAG